MKTFSTYGIKSKKVSNKHFAFLILYRISGKPSQTLLLLNHFYKGASFRRFLIKHPIPIVDAYHDLYQGDT